MEKNISKQKWNIKEIWLTRQISKINHKKIWFENPNWKIKNKNDQQQKISKKILDKNHSIKSTMTNSSIEEQTLKLIRKK